MEFFVLDRNAWNHLTVCKKRKRAEDHLKMLRTKCVYQSHIFNIYIYIYKEDLELNKLRWLIFHKTQPNQIIYS